MYLYLIFLYIYWYFIQQKCIKFIKSDSKDFYIVFFFLKRHKCKNK